MFLCGGSFKKYFLLNFYNKIVKKNGKNIMMFSLLIMKLSIKFLKNQKKVKFYKK